MVAEKTIILSAEQEAQLRQPIDEYVGNIQAKLNALREDGTNKVDQTFSLTDNFIGTIDGGIDPTTVDSFFSAGNFIGAISSSDNWMEGWTK